jgi:hypothetical protein
MVPVEEKKLRVNYFKGNDRSKWHCDVPTSGAVLYKNLYKNIDLKVYGIQKQIEYDWLVNPGGNHRSLRSSYLLPHSFPIFNIPGFEPFAYQS